MACGIVDEPKGVGTRVEVAMRSAREAGLTIRPGTVLPSLHHSPIDSKYGPLIYLGHLHSSTLLPCLGEVGSMGPYSEMVYTWYTRIPD